MPPVRDEGTPLGRRSVPLPLSTARLRAALPPPPKGTAQTSAYTVTLSTEVTVVCAPNTALPSNATGEGVLPPNGERTQAALVREGAVEA